MQGTGGRVSVPRTAAATSRTPARIAASGIFAYVLRPPGPWNDAAMKPALEFFPTAAVPWTAAGRGVSERVLARDDATGMLTRILRWAPGVDTSATGPVAHAHVEEVLILTGSMVDLTLGRTFRAGDFACRPPGMVHGPWRTDDGCEMLEVRYEPAAAPRRTRRRATP
jgi:anti-sigma factor ChrR (cupin superfamily)